MIRLSARFDQYAYSVPVKVAPELLENGFEEGQWVTPGENGYVLATDAKKKAFMLISSKRPGRDQFSGKVGAPAQIYVGPFALETDQVKDDDTFTPGAPLYVGADGKLTVTGGEGALVAAYVAGVYTNGFLPIVAA